MKKSIEKGIQIMNNNEDVEAYLNSFSDSTLLAMRIRVNSLIIGKPEGSLLRNRLEIYLDILMSIFNQRII